MNNKVKISVNNHILIVSDNADELNNIQHLLVDEFGSCLKACNDHDGLQLFNEKRPSLLILAFDEIEKAKRFYLALYRNAPQTKMDVHQTLLLCKSNESSKAYQLCSSRMFSDYVADRPLYDPYRLRLSVAQALNRCNHDKYSNLLSNKIERITGKLHQLDQLISTEFVSGGGQVQETMHKFQNFTQKLSVDLEQLEAWFHVKAPGEASVEINRKQLSHEFNRFRENSIMHESQSVVEQLNKMDGWLEKINKKSRVHMDEINQSNKLEHIVEVMLVDDDEFYRDSLKIMLKEFGMHVIVVNDGKSALSKLLSMHPDLILLDYNMPGIDGISTLEQIKSSSDLKSIPVIMLTGASDREIVTKSLETGAIDFIVKPSDRNIILSKIKGALGKRSLFY